MKWRAYQEYKNSGADRLGKIPRHWEDRKLKHVASTTFSNVDKHTVDGEEPVRLCNYVDVYYNDYITSQLDFMEATATPEEITKFKLRAGDVIVTKDSEEWDDIAVPAHVAQDLNGVLCGYHLALIRPDPNVVDGRYLFRAFASRGINDQFRIAATGITRYGLGKYELDNALLPVPPVPEQRAIADFLDQETVKIDAMIAKKERQIELLQEKRTALISHAVTKGLNPDVKMKNSGVEWLGEIPAHWEVLRLKYTSSINDEALPETTDSDYELLYVDIGSVDASAGIQKKELMRFEDAPSRARRKVRHGDVIVSTVRTYLRAIAPINEPEDNLIVSTGFAVIRPRKQLKNGFAAYSLRAPCFVDAVVARSVGVSYPAVNAIDIGDLRVAAPPASEQRTIAAFLDRETGRIDDLSKQIEKSIDLLREYRTALISAAVTGKIDVRHVVD